MTSTTAATSSSSTTPFQSKKHPTILPNAHPYAIKTTSSAVLSRSNSSPHSHSVKHNYVPQSPTRPRHRHTTSFSSVEGVSVNEITRPSPLPIPPSFNSVSPSFSLSDDATPHHRLKRADTLPSNAIVPVLHDNSVGEDNKLPRNPKHWSTEDLASHVATSLRAGSELSAEDQGHLLCAIKEQTITGRDFLRLTDADLASLSLTTAQRLYLLEASRALRADVLRGRIWVDSHHSKDIPAHSKGVYARPTRSSNSPFNSEFYNFSTSSVDLILPPSASIGVDGELPLSPAVTMNRSNSVSDSSAQRYKDLAHMRIRRRGKVKGLVDTWERESGAVSGSDGSVSGSDADSDSDSPSVESPPPPVLPNSTISLSNPPPPYTSLRGIEDEPTIEELLTSSGPIKGARAWEEDYGLGETVKRIPTSTPAPLPLAPTSLRVATAVEINADPNESSVECNLSKLIDLGNGRANTQKRIVTAIFTGSSDRKMDTTSYSIPVDDVPQANVDPGEVVDIIDAAELEVTAVESAEGITLVPDQVAAPSDDDTLIAVLEASIASTRVQLEAFRARLEIIEAQVATQEATYLRPEEARQPLDEHQLIYRSCDPAPAPDDIMFSDYHLGLKSFVRSIIARTVGWFYPYSHLGARPRPEVKAARSGEPSFFVLPRILPAFRLSYVIMFSIALCAAVLRRVGKSMRGR
ncbi:hypothetical protein DEU56DRAFT_179377 [Suillus clintonianus]|uniref:uncharacterized protein n=1 Tax=Suillus clintonianus TaxID=1904413 RepID=UPI001B85E5B9|nr:uncharacterized protein DEU56DRAFT_179377 [Suillus clintonianus]KAG2115010.1 hypothetical protein DEU56DRAFT_179377 [Suillus clintonianus]